jgi:hypothetical protein
VQVKSGDDEGKDSDVQLLYFMGVYRKEFWIGRRVGFKRNDRDFAFEKPNLKLIDGDEMVELIYK